MKLRAYVIETDAGSAPNYDAPCTTLAVCKPQIRRVAAIGDVVVAFAGQKLNRFEPHTVVWVGVVTEKMTFADYWNDPRFAGKRPDRCARPDNFYRPTPDGGLLWVDNPVHGPAHFRRDTGGRFVLTFEPSWRFGAHGPVLPADFGVRIPMNARRAGRVVTLNAEEWLLLKDWLDGQSQLETSPPPSGRKCSPPGRPFPSQPVTRRRSSC